MPDRRRCAALAAATLAFAATASPIGAAASSEMSLDRTLAPLARASRLVSTSSLAEAVRTAADVAGVPLAPPAVHERARGEDAVAALLEHVRTAERVARASVADLAELRALDHAVPLAATTSAYGVDGGRRSHKGPAIAELRARLDRALDRASLYSAAYELASALDATVRSLPPLASVSAVVDGCDVEDVPGVLCVGGPGANHYTDDYALLIDLGGDDVHANAAGGADPMREDGVPGLPVSVTLDLSGTDRYESTVPAQSGARAVQGASTEGGIGILVDVEGNDSYSAVASGAGEDVNALAQGYARAGVGIVADLAGDDRYEIRDSDLGLNHHGGADALAMGLGAAGTGGLAIAVDAGSGDDTAAVEARPVAPLDIPGGGGLNGGPAVAAGFGLAGIGGAALFVGGGGADSFGIAAATAPIAPDETRALGNEAAFQSVPQGFGTGAAGTGLALTGAGPTEWSVSSEARGPLTFIGTAWGLGYGILGGYGGLYDAGGDDRYLARAETATVAARTADEACSCGDVEASALGGAASIDALGAAFAGGVGVLHDVAGADTYRSEAVVRTTATARDERSSPPAGSKVVARSSAGGAFTGSHGHGNVDALGALVDDAGDDVYASVTDLLTGATATSAASTPRAAYATGYGATSASMASSLKAGMGLLRDLGGADRYQAINSASASASPPTQRSSGAVTARSLGSTLGGSSFLADLDGGGIDEFVSVPENPACSGVRGSGAWRDCYSSTAGGVAY